MNNAKHFINRKTERMHKNEKASRYDRLHRAATVVLEQLKDRGEVTVAALYDLEAAL